MSQKHNLVVQKTATYYSLGTIKSAKTIWIVLHGYGYLAKYFIKKFEPILGNEIVIIAPEGLSRFYLDGVDTNSRVGACWMTKENREEEIIDYIHYLNQLYATILEQNDNKQLKINIVGFSQGGATASRWIADGKVNCTNFILWASIFPDDMNFMAFGKISTFFIYGDEDQFVTKERLKYQKEIFKKSDLKVKTAVFKGGHDIPKAVLVEQAELIGW